jgi:hypothetical protein
MTTAYSSFQAESSIPLLLPHKNININQEDLEGHTVIFHFSHGYCHFKFKEPLQQILMRPDLNINHPDLDILRSTISRDYEKDIYQPELSKCAQILLARVKSGITLKGKYSINEIGYAFKNQVTFSNLTELAKKLFDADFKKKVLEGSTLSFIIFTDETDKPQRRESTKLLAMITEAILHNSTLKAQAKLQTHFTTALQQDFALVWEFFHVIINAHIENPFNQNQWQTLTSLLNNATPLTENNAAYHKLKTLVNTHQVFHVASRQLKDVLEDHQTSAATTSTPTSNEHPNLGADHANSIRESIKMEFEFNLKDVKWNDRLLDSFTLLCSPDESTSEEEYIQRQNKVCEAVDACAEHGSDLEKFLTVPHKTFPNIPKDQLPFAMTYFREQALTHIESVRQTLLNMATAPSAPELEPELNNLIDSAPEAPKYEPEVIEEPEKAVVTKQGHFARKHNNDDDDDLSEDNSGKKKMEPPQYG